MSLIRCIYPYRWTLKCYHGVLSQFPLPTASAAAAPVSNRFLHSDPESYTRDFYGIEVDLKERALEKEKWRRILAERAAQEALASGQTPFEASIVPPSSLSTMPKTTSAAITSMPHSPVLAPAPAPPPPPAPAASMTLRDFNLEPRRARQARKKAALGVPFQIDVATQLPSGIEVRFDKDNLPLMPYPTEPVDRLPKVWSLVEALTPLDSVNQLMKHLRSVEKKNILEEGTRAPVEVDNELGQLKNERGPLKEVVVEKLRTSEEGRKRKSLVKENHGMVFSSVLENYDEESSPKGKKTRLNELSPPPPPPLRSLASTDDTKMKEKELPPVETLASSDDMNYFDEQLMLAQFDFTHAAGGTTVGDWTTTTKDVERDFDADLERMSRAARGFTEDDPVKESLRDMNYFDSLYVENSDFRGMKFEERESPGVGWETDFGTTSTKIADGQLEMETSDLNFFDEQLFSSSGTSTNEKGPMKNNLSKAASIIDEIKCASRLASSTRVDADENGAVSIYPSSLSPAPSTSSPSTIPPTPSMYPPPSLLTPKFRYEAEPITALSRKMKRFARPSIPEVEMDGGLTPSSGSQPLPNQQKGRGGDIVKLDEARKTLNQNAALIPPAKLGEKRVDSQGYRKYSDLVADLTWATRDQLFELLHRRVIFNNCGLVAVDKPYGLACQGGPGVKVSIDDLLPDLAKALGHEQLKTVHRLDRSTTGVLIFATTDDVMRRVKRLFKERSVLKMYVALCRGQPALDHGHIKIPLMDFKYKSGFRTTVKPERDEVEEDTLSQGLLKDLIDAHDMKKMAGKPPKHSFDAITKYEVLDSNAGISLLEVQPDTGFKHQIRAHLAYGLNTPILGDHKYSHLNAIKPQRLSPFALQALKIRQPLARHIPLQLHAKSIVLPEFNRGKNVFVSANPPFHFTEMVKLLGLRFPDMKGGTQL